jgi:hypothetical protein
MKLSTWIYNRLARGLYMDNNKRDELRALADKLARNGE